MSKFVKLFSVLMVIALFGVLASSALAAPPAQKMDIVDTAVADGRFKTLATALTAAGLIDTLKGPGPFTVFAPTDDAFAKLPAGTLDKLLADKKALTDILLYHVVKGKVMAADVVKLKSADTVLGKPVMIKVDGNKVMINESQVIITDIETSNGVIHVIDTVLIPPAETPAALPETGGEMSTTPTLLALVAAGLALVAGGFGLLRLRAVRVTPK
jgi:transforming growth factor-beta-induced protein